MKGDMFWPPSLCSLKSSVFVSIGLALVACGDETSTGASDGLAGGPSVGGGGGFGGGPGAAGGVGGGGGFGGGPGAAGGMGGKKLPGDVTSEADCFFTGAGGLDCPECEALTVDLSVPVPRAGLEVSITTSIGELYEGCDAPGPPGIVCIGNPVEVIQLEDTCFGLIPELDYFDIDVTLDGATIGSGHFDRLSYSCVAQTSDDWCWQAAPVLLEVTPPPR